MTSETVGRPMEILLVEDNPADARLAIESLRDGDVQHRLTLIFDGMEAMEFLRRRGRFARAPRPDLILLDLQLPTVDGREVLSDIKTDDELQRIPIIILTASEAHEDKLRSEMLHVDGYMVKPVDMEKFVSVVRQLKNRWHADVTLPTVD